MGDTHGDYSSTLEMLRAMGFVNENGAWSAGKTDLVVLGDMVGKGKNSFQNLQYLLSLQRSAARRGGRVHLMPGNHEWKLLLENYSSLTDKDIRRFEKFYDGENIFSADHSAGKWLANAPVALIIDDSLFLHGGVNRKWLNTDLTEINTNFKNWVRYFQGVGEEPSGDTEWIVSHEGPLYNRELIHGDIKDKHVRKIAEHYGVARIVVGHTPTKDGEVSYFDMGGIEVVQGDTGASRVLSKGALRIIEIKGGQSSDWEIADVKGELPLMKRVSSALSCSYAKLTDHGKRE